MPKKKTVVLVASTKEDRYSFLAVRRLRENDHPVVPLGYKKGSIDKIDILLDFPPVEDVHTITLYLNPARQHAFYDYIIAMAPKRIIFNPGTENLELQKLAEASGIETQIACTLVLLSIGNY